MMRVDSIEKAVTEAVHHTLAPALSVHAGSIVLKSITDQAVELSFLGSCRSCYFRRGCAAHLVSPTIKPLVGTDMKVRVTGVGEV